MLKGQPLLRSSLSITVNWSTLTNNHNSYFYWWKLTSLVKIILRNTVCSLDLRRLVTHQRYVDLVVQNVCDLPRLVHWYQVPVWRNTALEAKNKSGFSKLSAKESLRNRIQQIVSENIAKISNQQIVSRKISHSANIQQKWGQTKGYSKLSANSSLKSQKLAIEALNRNYF